MWVKFRDLLVSVIMVLVSLRGNFMEGQIRSHTSTRMQKTHPLRLCGGNPRQILRSSSKCYCDWLTAAVKTA